MSYIGFTDFAVIQIEQQNNINEIERLKIEDD